jgi:hypothetical protein
MTAIILLLAMLSLSAGFFVLFSGRREPQSCKPATHKLNIRKAVSQAIQEVKDDPPEGLSMLECKAIQLEEDEPIDIFIDLDTPLEERLLAGEKLIDAGFTLNPNKEQTSNDNQRNACGVDQSEKTTTDEDDRPPLELTGE